MALNIKPFYPIEHPDLTSEVNMEDYHDIDTGLSNNIEFRKKQLGRAPIREKEKRGKRDILEELLERLHII